MNIITDFLDETAKKFPNKISIVDDKNSITFSNLQESTLKFASEIIKFPKQSVVSLIFENSIECVIAYLGILKAGCIAHLISPSISKQNLINQMQSSDSKILIFEKENFSDINEIECEKIQISEIYKQKKIEFVNRVDENDIAYLIYTSGTTSIPKGAGISHKSSIFTTQNIINYLDYKDSDIDLLPLSLSHSFGLGCLHVSLFIGSTLYLQKNSSKIDEIIKSIKINNITTLAAVPPTLSKILSYDYKQMFESISNLRLIVTNSTKIQSDVVKKYQKILKKGKIVTYYGLTEASRSTFMIFDKTKYDSVGIPPKGVQIKIMDSHDNLSKEGEICINGDNVINQYWKNKKADANIVDGWLKTGDIGRLDSDGYLYVLGRLDDVINVAGEKVIPQEVEELVKKIPEIDEAIAVPMNHEIFGTVIKLYVKKVPNSEIQISQILKYCISNLERFKVPAKIELIDEFPKTEYGKIKRYNLK